MVFLRTANVYGGYRQELTPGVPMKKPLCNFLALAIGLQSGFVIARQKGAPVICFSILIDRQAKESGGP